jgi:hypothetical protein
MNLEKNIGNLNTINAPKRILVWNEDEDDIHHSRHIDSNMLKQITGNDILYSRKIGESGKKWKFSCVDKK